MREVLGVDVNNSEDVEHWRGFLQDLVARGVRGVKLVISDAHRGLKQAIAKVFGGASCQRCRVHFLRNLEKLMPKNAQAMVAATSHTSSVVCIPCSHPNQRNAVIVLDFFGMPPS